MPLIVCPRCEDVGKDLLNLQLVGRLCEKCGNSMVRIDEVVVKKTDPKTAE